MATTLSSADGAAMPAAAKRGFALPLAAWIAHRRREAAPARAWLEAARGGFVDPASQAYAEATVYAAEGNLPAARQAIAAARAALPQIGDRGGAAALADWLGELERELGSATTGATPLAAQT